MASALELDGLNVLEATITLPLRGNWRADLVVSSKTTITGTQTLDDNGIAYEGTVERGGLDLERWLGRIVGGNGGLTSQRLPRPYRETTAGIVLADLLLEAGERMSNESDPTVLTYALPQWLRFGTTEDAIEALVVDKIGANWRVLRDGSVWFGTDTFPEQTVSHIVEEQNDDRRVWVVATEKTELEPGRSFEGREVVQVVHRVTPDGLRTEVVFGS